MMIDNLEAWPEPGRELHKLPREEFLMTEVGIAVGCEILDKINHLNNASKNVLLFEIQMITSDTIQEIQHQIYSYTKVKNTKSYDVAISKTSPERQERILRHLNVGLVIPIISKKKLVGYRIEQQEQSLS